MTYIRDNNSFKLAISPSTLGLGYAVLEGDNLVDWGVRTTNGNKNAESLRKLKQMILHYKPRMLIMEDFAAKGCHRPARIKRLGQQVAALAKEHGVRLRMVPRQQVKNAFLPNGKGSKDDIAAIIAKRFPAELGQRLPPRRKAWMREAYQMGVFDAVAFSLV